MGTEENHVFMKMVAAMISLRQALSASEPDLRAAMHVIISNEALLKQFPSVEPELLRVRIELENQDAVKLIEAGLTNGRYLGLCSGEIGSLFDMYVNVCMYVDAIGQMW